MKRKRDYPISYWESHEDEVEVTAGGRITIPKKLLNYMKEHNLEFRNCGQRIDLMLCCHGDFYSWQSLKRYTIRVPYAPFDHLQLAIQRNPVEGYPDTCYIKVTKIGPYHD